MLKMVDGTGIIGVDMICPLGISTPQPPNYDRVELEGTGMLVLPNSLDAPLERLELGGKTEQVTTTWKNLFDPNNNYEDLVWIRNDGEIVAGSNARTSDYIPVEQGNYAFQFDVINNNQMFVAGYNTDKQFVKIVGTISRGKCIIKIDNIEIETIRLSYTRESTRIQLERSETQTPYEPYTGGKPSPSPEYPQEIKNSGKWNEETQKYEVDVKITNAEQNWSKEQTLTLALDQPLRGIGEMKDELSESGILRRVKNIALNGSEKWYKYENSAFVAMNCYGLKIDDLEVRNYSLTTLCNFFKWARFPQDIESQAAHGGYIYFTVPKETYPDLESFKGWLAKNTPVLEYWLKEPALEELSEEDKASIRALKTYYPTTVITADGGELDPDIKVTYRKEI